MSEWKECNLGQFINIKHGFAFKGKYITEETTKDILVTPGNFHIGGGFKSSKFKYFKGEYPSEYVLKKNDIIVTMTDLSKDGDTLGYSAKVPRSNGKNYLHNQRIGLIQFLSNEIDKDFIYWLMRTKDYQGFIVGAASGTSIRHTSPTTIREYQFLKPPLPEQRAIASVLSSLDDKIDLLHRQNKTLEAMAETLFRQRFVEEADEGWGEGKLEDIISLIESGSRPKGGIDPYLKIGIPSIGAENINGIGNYDFSKTKYVTEAFYKSIKRGFIKDYDILIYKDGAYVGRKGMFGIGFPYKKCIVNEHVFILRSNEKSNQLFIYYLLKEEELAQLNANSAQPGLNQEAMKSFKVIMPPKYLMDEFEYLAKPWIDKILFNSKQIHTLEKLRDTLLPKLMSGEVMVEF